jgi:ADP-ribosyl-[dinitrogen reductase] hydrolase
MNIIRATAGGFDKLIN